MGRDAGGDRSASGACSASVGLACSGRQEHFPYLQTKIYLCNMLETNLLKKNLGKVCLELQVWGYLLTCPSFLVLTSGRFSLGFLESFRSRNYLKPSCEVQGFFQQTMCCTARNRREI